MNTQLLISRYIHHCEERGLSPSTQKGYYSRLKYFAQENPELPTTLAPIEKYLKARKEPPNKRGMVFNVLQGFYSYLEMNENIKSPVPPRGPEGRPHKSDPLTNSRREVITQIQGQPQLTTSGGGQSESTSISISTPEAVKEFIDARKFQGVHDATLENYQSFFKYFIERFPILPLAPKPIEEYLGSLPVSHNSKWLYWTELKAFYRFYCTRKHLYNPMTEVFRLKMERKVRETLEISQLKELLALELSPRDRAIVMLLIDCGPRSGEIVSLTREQVLENAIVVKGKTGEHQVPISKETHDLLVQLAASGPLFRTEKGVLGRRTLYFVIRGLLEKIGKTQGKRGAHLLRHSMARGYVENDGDIISLQQVMGHESIKTTERYAKMSQQGVNKQHGQHTPLNLVLPQDHGELVEVIREASPNNARAIDSANRWLCRCRQCAHNALVEEGAMERTRCTQCGAVGCWFVINHIDAGEGKKPPDESKAPAPVPVTKSAPEQGLLFPTRPEPEAERLTSSPPGTLSSGRKGAPRNDM